MIWGLIGLICIATLALLAMTLAYAFDSCTDEEFSNWKKDAPLRDNMQDAIKTIGIFSGVATAGVTTVVTCIFLAIYAIIAIFKFGQAVLF